MTLEEKQKKIINGIKKHINKIKREIKQSGYSPMYEYNEHRISVDVYLMFCRLMEFKPKQYKTYEQYIMFCGVIDYGLTCGTMIRSPDVCLAINKFNEYIFKIKHGDVYKEES